MTAKEFEAVIDNVFVRARTVLGAKAAEYATTEDRLSNFRRAGAMLGCSPERALLGMAVKHWSSIVDLVAGFDREPDAFTDVVVWDEKLGDMLNYLVLLRALVEERV